MPYVDPQRIRGNYTAWQVLADGLADLCHTKGLFFPVDFPVRCPTGWNWHSPQWPDLVSWGCPACPSSRLWMNMGQHQSCRS